MLSILAAAVLAPAQIAQVKNPPKLQVSRKLFENLGIRRQRNIAPVNRLFVTDKAINATFTGKLFTINPYAFMDACLLPNIEKAKIEIEDQGYRGTCTIFATKFLAEYELARQKNFASSIRLNPEYLNWTANEAEKSYIDGSSFPAVCTGLDNWGCCLWNQDKVYGKNKSDFNPKYKPSDSTLNSAGPQTENVTLNVIFSHSTPVMSDKEMSTVLSLLDAGIPVGVGQQWPAQGAWKTTEANGLNVTDGTGEVKGAHTMAIVGYKKNAKVAGGGYFMFRNSWGTDKGYDGYLFMSFDWVKNHVYDGCIAAKPEFIH